MVSAAVGLALVRAAEALAEIVVELSAMAAERLAISEDSALTKQRVRPREGRARGPANHLVS